MGAVVPRDLFIIVHNIDGLALRSPTTQMVRSPLWLNDDLNATAYLQILARLASLPQIHMLATIDHAYSPLCT